MGEARGFDCPFHAGSYMIHIYNRARSLYQSAKIILACYAYALARGRADRVPSHISCVAVVQVAKVGDMVLTTPVFHAIRKKYPRARVLVVGGVVGKRILEGTSDVDEVILYQENAFELARVFKSKGIDVAVVTNPSPEIIAAFFLAGVPLISTFTLIPPKKFYVPFGKTYQLLKHLMVLKPFYVGAYMPAQYLTLLEPIGVKDTIARLRLSCTEDRAVKVREELASHDIILNNDFVVAIAPGGKEIRQWPADRFARLAHYLHAHYAAKIVLVGAGPDSEAVREVSGGLDKDVLCVNMLDQPLHELTALVAQVDLLVSNDSGPVTFAEAFDTRSIMIVGPTDEKEHHYEDEIHKIVVAPMRGEPVTYARNWFNFDREEAFRQIRAVSFEQAREVVDEVLASELPL